MSYYVNGLFTVVNSGGKPYTVTIQIPQQTWDACSDEVRTGVDNILQVQPIALLPSSGKGNGIKQESKGVEFHTQTDKRLQCAMGTIKDKTFLFDRYGKGWGH